MATYTTNINLKKPAQSDKIRIADFNGNADNIDAAFGADFGQSSKPSVNASINNLADGLAILAQGNVHAAISAGQFVYVRGHGTLGEGLYVANQAISANGTLSSSNLDADTSGGLNALNSKLTSIVTSGSLHDYAGQNGLYWLTSAVSDKPVQNGGLLIIRSYGSNYSVGEYLADNGDIYSITFVNNTWTYEKYQRYNGIKSFTRETNNFTTGATGNVALGVSNSTGKLTVVSPICTTVDAVCRLWIATSNNGWYVTLVNPNTGATINNTNVTITYCVVETY